MNISSQAFLVFAASPWNASGIQLQAGKRYRIAPFAGEGFTQEWQDWTITCGPSGWEGTVGGLSSSALNALLRVKKLDGKNQRYFSMIGCVGKSLDHPFLIGEGIEFVPTVSGELYAFANDAGFAYSNNHGQMVVKVDLLR